MPASLSTGSEGRGRREEGVVGRRRAPLRSCRRDAGRTGTPNALTRTDDGGYLLTLLC